MSDADSDGWLSEAVESGQETVRKTLSVLGVQRDVFSCPDCEAACEPTHTHDPQRAAFSNGESPAWECPECSREFVRESDDGVHTLDLYGRE